MKYSIAAIITHTLVLDGSLNGVTSFSSSNNLSAKPEILQLLSSAYDDDQCHTEPDASSSYADFLAKGIFQKDDTSTDDTTTNTCDHNQQWWQGATNNSKESEKYELSDLQLSDILSFANPVDNNVDARSDSMVNNPINSIEEVTDSPFPFATRLECFNTEETSFYEDEYLGGGAPSSPFSATSTSTNSIFSNRDAKESSTSLQMSTTTETEGESVGSTEQVDNVGNEYDKEPILGDGNTLTERMFSKIPTENQAGGAGGSSTLNAFKRAEKNWERLKAFKPFNYDKNVLQWTQDGHGPPPQFVSTDGAFGNPMCWEKLKNSAGKQLDYDVVVCGGTLGIFFGLYLQLQGHSVCVVEAGKLRGREQEWNISMDELTELLELGIITQEDIDAVITTEFPACRSGFKNKEVTPLEGGYFQNGEVGYETLTPDVLNLGVTPAILLERVSNRFLESGGVIKEETRLSGVCVSDLVGTAIDLGDQQEPITARLVLDCMGNASPISAQQRYGQKPDGICCVVGSCAGGYDKETNIYGDIIYTNQPIVTREGKGSNQYFWEAFPVGIGRGGKEPGTSDVKTTYSKYPRVNYLFVFVQEKLR